jgi:hypothetical protein
MNLIENIIVPICIIHLLWVGFFLSGLLVRRGNSNAWNAFSLADLVMTSVAGMAANGFALLALGFCHLLSVGPILALILIQGSLFRVMKKERIFSKQFWFRIARCFRNILSPPTLFLWVLFLVLAVPALLPPKESDAVRYHLPYAVEWARAGCIFVDPFLRFPCYANNFLLLYSGLFIFKLGQCCQLLGWLTGLLTCLGIQAFIYEPMPEKREAKAPLHYGVGYFAQYLIPLFLASNPIFLRYLDFAYIDIPIGLFVLTTLLCTQRSFTGGQTYELELIVIAAFCVGMKITLIAYLPLFLALLGLTLGKRIRIRRSIWLYLILIMLSSPWYVRNFIVVGDPVPPFVNAHFNRPDAIFDHADALSIFSEPSTKHSILQLLQLPLRFYKDPKSPDFRENAGNTAMLLSCAVIPALILQFSFPRSFLSSRSFLHLTIVVGCLQVFWLLTSTLGRYSLHWLPAYIAWLGIILVRAHQCVMQIPRSDVRTSTTGVALTIVSVAMICPFPRNDAFKFYKHFYDGAFPQLSRLSYRLIPYGRVKGYFAAEAVIQTLKTNGCENRKILNLMLEIQFYTARDGVAAIGDYFGPARYGDLWSGVQNGDVGKYLGKFDVAAVIVDPIMLSPESWAFEIYPALVQQLKNHGFVEYRYDPDPTPVFLHSTLNPSSVLRATENGSDVSGKISNE